MMLQEHSPKNPRDPRSDLRPLARVIGATGLLLVLAAGPSIAQSPAVPVPSIDIVGVASPMPSPTPGPTGPLCPGALPGRSDIVYPSSDPVAAASPSPFPFVSPSVLPSPSLTASAEPGSSPALSTPSPTPWLATTGPSPSADPCEPAQVGLGAGPSQLLLGTERSGSFDVYNAGNVEELVTIRAFDYVRTEDGAIQLLEEPTPLGAADWIVFDHPRILLQPGVSTTITFTVDPPLDASPGDHFTKVLIEAGMSDDAAARLPQAEGGLRFRSNLQSTVTVVARVDGTLFPRIVVPPFEAFLPNLVLSADGSYTFTPTIENEGNVAAVWMPVGGRTSDLDAMVPTIRLAPTGGVFADAALLVDGERTADGFALSPLVVLPGATHTQRLTLTDAPLFGTYDYLYTLPGSEADGRQTITRTGSFTVINLQKVLFWVVLPLMLLLLLGSLVAFRRHRIGTQRRMAAALRARELQLARQEAYEQAWREQQAARGHPLR